MNPCRWVGVGAIALFTCLSYTPILRAETATALSLEGYQIEGHPTFPSDLALTEITAPSREETHITTAIATTKIDSVNEVKPLLPLEQTSVELLHPPVDISEKVIDEGFDETVRLLSNANSDTLPRSAYHSQRQTTALRQEQDWSPSIDTVNEVTINAIQEEDGLLNLTDNRAGLLQPLEMADNQQEDTLQAGNLQANEASSVTDKEDWPSPIHDNQVFWLVLVDELEYRFNDGTDALNWDILAWVGGDYQRLWIETEGEIGVAGDGSGEAELQLLYGQLVSPFWDFQAGLRYDRTFGPGRDLDRAFVVVGMQGLTPYLFEVDAALFISEEGDVSARFEAEYSFLLTQRLILQPELEVNVAAQQVEDFGVGSGLNDIELSLRLRYEVSRQFAPYVGVSWTRKFGQTADFAREEGESTDNFAVVGGLRLLF